MVPIRDTILTGCAVEYLPGRRRLDPVPGEKLTV